RPLCSPLFPYTTLFRSEATPRGVAGNLEFTVHAVCRRNSECRALSACCDWSALRHTVALLLKHIAVGVDRADLGETEFAQAGLRSEEHTSELQSRENLV